MNDTMQVIQFLVTQNQSKDAQLQAAQAEIESLRNTLRNFSVPADSAAPTVQ